MAALVGVVAAGCRAAPPPPPPSELRVGILGLDSLDPIVVSGSERAPGEALVLRQVFEGLVGFDPATLQPRPALAASWRASPDARTFTFLLRPGARFHSGREVTAQDVVFSLNRLARAACRPPASPGAAAPSYLLSLVVGYPEVAGSCKAPALAGVQAVGPRTVMISLSEPWADFPAALGNLAAAVVPADLVGADEGGFGRQPVGTGPWRVVSPWDGRSLVLERFDGYWGPGARIPRVRFVGYADEGTAYLDLLRGALHYAPVPPSRVAQARRRFGDRGFVRGTGLYFFGYNLRSRRLAPLAFREGLDRAVDRRALATAVFEGTREPARGLAPPTLPGAEGSSCGERCAFDPEGARAEIAQAYPQGAPEVTIGVSQEGANPEVGEAMARMFATVGVTARVVERPFLEHIRGLEAGDVDVFQLGWVPDYPALDGLLWPLFRSTARENYMGYRNPDVDRLLEEARGTLDARVRARLYLDAERRILADLPLIPLLWYRTSVALDPRLRGVGGGPVVDPLGGTAFARLEFAPR